MAGRRADGKPRAPIRLSTLLTTPSNDRLAMAKFSKSRVWDKVSERSTLFLELPEFPYNTVYAMSKEAFMPKISSIHLALLIEHPVVTETGQTDTGP